MKLDPEDLLALLRFDTNMQAHLFTQGASSAQDPQMAKLSLFLSRPALRAAAKYVGNRRPGALHGLPCDGVMMLVSGALPAGTKSVVSCLSHVFSTLLPCVLIVIMEGFTVLQETQEAGSTGSRHVEGLVVASQHVNDSRAKSWGPWSAQVDEGWRLWPEG